MAAAKQHVIAWRNTWSNETGYVKKIAKDHFENTFEQSEAKKYASAKTAQNAADKLKASNEGKLNDFSVVICA